MNILNTILNKLTIDVNIEIYKGEPVPEDNYPITNIEALTNNYTRN